MHIIAGEAYGLKSPVHVFSKMFYLDLQFGANSTIKLTDAYEERAIFVVEGVLEIGGATHTAGTTIVCDAGEVIMVSARDKARAMFLGEAR